MTKFQPKIGSESKITETINNGTFYVTTDTNKIIVDYNNTRLQITDLIIISNEEALPTTGLNGKLYVAVAEGTIWLYANSWVSLGKEIAEYTLPVATMTSVGGVSIDGTTTKLNSLNQLVACGFITVNNLVMGVWFGTKERYDEDWNSGLITQSTICFITNDNDDLLVDVGNGTQVDMSNIYSKEEIDEKLGFIESGLDLILGTTSEPSDELGEDV